MNMNSLTLICNSAIQEKESLLLGVLNAAKLVNACKDLRLLASLKAASFIVADGMSVVCLSRLCGSALPQRVTGIDIMSNLLKLADQHRYGVYFLGARKHVVETVVNWTKENFPNVRISGFHDGYFNPDEEEGIAKNIRDSKIDILFVAITSPKKENFLSRWKDTINISICHGVGGSFDVIAGESKRAPNWMQKTGLEWLYRVLQEPRRMWKRYLITNPVFIVLGFIDIVRYRFSR